VLASGSVKKNRAADKETKLGTYLRRQGLSHRVFAARAGVPHLHPMVGLWAKGTRFPSIPTAMAIETATGGEVTVSYWGGLKRRHARSIPRQAGSR
jgi:hypothetical protein